MIGDEPIDTQIILGVQIIYNPPYLLTCGSYNYGKRGFRGWTSNDDLDLMRILTDLSDRGVNFALSNVIEHKGNTNDALIA